MEKAPLYWKYIPPKDVKLYEVNIDRADFTKKVVTKYKQHIVKDTNLVVYTYSEEHHWD